MNPPTDKVSADPNAGRARALVARELEIVRRNLRDHIALRISRGEVVRPIHPVAALFYCHDCGTREGWVFPQPLKYVDGEWVHAGPPHYHHPLCWECINDREKD